ncbi:MAG: CPBP family intramembrane glutamic endopeptidase [Candidatus Dormibacteria bacterium]
MAVAIDGARASWFRRQNREPLAGVTTTAVDWPSVGLYVLFTYGLGWSAWVGLRPVFPQLAIRTFIAMFAPTFATIAVIRLQRASHLRHEFRQSWRGLVDNIFASVLAIFVIGLPIAAGFGLSLFSGDLKLPGSSGANLFDVLPLPIAVFVYWVTAFGEEYGWRGFLVPNLAPLGGAQAAILVALIFAVWHAPAILVDGFNYPRHHVLGMFAMLVFSLPFSLVQAWLRSSTRHVAAPTMGHAMLNICTGLLYSHTARTTSIIAAPVGLLGTLPFAIVALVLLITGRLWRSSTVPPLLHPRETAAATAPT